MTEESAAHRPVVGKVVKTQSAHDKGEVRAEKGGGKECAELIECVGFGETAKNPMPREPLRVGLVEQQQT